jgi:hypothetical protein
MPYSFHAPAKPIRYGGFLSLCFFLIISAIRVLFSSQSSSLHKAFELRQKSDYREMIVIEREAAMEIYEKARMFVAAISQHIHQS